MKAIGESVPVKTCMPAAVCLVPEDVCPHCGKSLEED